MVSLEEIRKITSGVEALRGDMVRCLQELVRIPSVVGEEKKAQSYMATLYRDLGLEVKTITADYTRVCRHPAFVESGKDFTDRPNVSARWTGSPDKRSLILNGHVDVVSPEPVESWTKDPWGGEIEGNRIYGRGAGDMKAGLVANAFAVKVLKETGLDPGGSVILESVVDEEAGGAGGTLTCLLNGDEADAFLCTEPHGIHVTIAHAGISHFRVRVTGRTAHGGLAHEGINAIGKMIPIYRALERLDQIRGEKTRYPLFDKGSGRSCHLSVGKIQGGDWPSTVAGAVDMECRISFIPGERLFEIKELVEETIHAVAQKDPWLKENPPVVKWFGWQTEPWQQDAKHPFIVCLKEAAETMAERKVSFIGRASGLDARFAPYFGMPSACIGPRAGNIHGIDEFVEIPSVLETCKILSLVILNWCGQMKS